MWFPWFRKKIVMSTEFKVVVEHYHHFPVGQTITDQILTRLGKLERKMSELSDKVAAATTAGQNLTSALDAEITRNQSRVAHFEEQVSILNQQIEALKAMPESPETLAQIDALTEVMENATAKINALNATSPEVLPEE